MKSHERLLALALAASFVAACSGGGNTPGPMVTPTPGGVLPTPGPVSSQPANGAPSAAPSPVSATAFTCPASDTVSAVARQAPTSGDAVRRRANGGRRVAPSVPGRLEVSYDLHALSGARIAYAAREAAQSARLIREFDFARTGVATRVLSVPPARAIAVAASLRSMPGVRAVALGGPRRAKQAVTTPYFTNDPYFTGFAQTAAIGASTTPPPATYEVPPYEESASVPGQWNMHAIGLEHAFAYSQTNNGSGVTNANAVGSSSVKIAIIDTGEDTTHPELHAKIAYQKCFITNPDSGVQSSSDFTTDEDGHGTDVAGIAAASTNNSLGFAGAGGQSSIYAYRVQATPDDSCATEGSSDLQCTVDTADIASSIEDAIAQGVNVISLSLGGGSCTNGQDPDTVLQSAIADALAANVVVVASAGNDGSEGVEAPACVQGVIAAGATSLADGQPNGTGAPTGSPSAPIEYVASYSDYGSPGAAIHSSSAWGIVAPGGDPINDKDPDDLHWIEDTWTSTPLDTNFAGGCVPDYPETGSTIDCRTQIAGTSMSAPTVAGAAALIIAVNSSYRSPSKMKQLLCATADEIADAKEGCGRLNVYRAMATAVDDPNPP